MKRILFVALALVLSLAVVLTGCQPQKQFLTIATGSTAGVYFPLGGGLAQILNENIPGMEATVRSTGASVANVNLLAEKQVELAFIQNDITHYGFTGIEMFADKKNDQMRGIATLYPEVVQLVVTEASGIRSVADLKGKRVALGAPGSGVEANSRQILEAFGVKHSDLQRADFLSFAEASTNMRDGHIDAAFTTSGFPTAAVTEMATALSVRLIPITGPEVLALQAKYPFYRVLTIPAGTYRGQTEDVSTIAVKAMLVVRADVSEKLVYDITKALFNNLEAFGASHVRGRDLSLATARENMPIPLHPGAERFFQERR